MRAVRFEQYGGVEVLNVVDVPDPVVGQGQVVIAVKAAGINPGEGKIREGLLHEMYPASFPSGQGSDFAGVVEQVGEGVLGIAAGDEVIGWTDNRAGQAEKVLAEATKLAPRPTQVPWEVAGALFVAGCTGWATVRAVELGGDDTVVISGAAGGVGVFATQLAVNAGARTIGLASEHNHEWLRAHGVVPVTYGDGAAARIRDAASDGVNAFIDLSGDGYVDLALELGVAPSRIDTVVDFAAASKGVKLEGSAAAASAAVLEDLARLIVAGQLEIPIAATYSLDEVRDAYLELERGHTRGKIVLIP